MLPRTRPPSPSERKDDSAPSEGTLVPYADDNQPWDAHAGT